MSSPIKEVLIIGSLEMTVLSRQVVKRSQLDVGIVEDEDTKRLNADYLREKSQVNYLNLFKLKAYRVRIRVSIWGTYTDIYSETVINTCESAEVRSVDYFTISTVYLRVFYIS